MDLPSRDAGDEDAFVQGWSASDDTDGLIEVIEQAMAARRPLLAARLFGLLEQHVEFEPGSPLARAGAAARLLLLTPDVATEAWDDLEEAWSLARKRRMRRIRARMRQSTSGSQERVPRVGRTRRR